MSSSFISLPLSAAARDPVKYRKKYKRPKFGDGFIFGFAVRLVIFLIAGLSGALLATTFVWLNNWEVSAFAIALPALVTVVTIAGGELLRNRLLEEIRLLSGPEVEIEVSAEGLRAFELRGRAATGATEDIHPIDQPARYYPDFQKRLLDVLISIVAGLMLMPLFLVTTFLIWVVDGGPVLQRHARLGRNNQVVYLYKFRTLRADAEEVLERFLADNPNISGAHLHLAKDPRFSRVGAVLHTLSIDELPQFYNILVGDMSIVGPAPRAVGDNPDSSRWYGASDVRPGLTGLWQIAGRLHLNDRKALDHLYAKSKTVFLDLKIIARTVPAVLAAVLRERL